jgi:hypothetical protein
MTEERPTNEELAEEARRWDSREITPAGWQDAPEAIPRAKESTAISLRLPVQMVAILKEFARRSGIGYQVLMKRWLDERIRQEREHLQRELARRPNIIKLRSPTVFSESTFDASSVRDLTVGATNAASQATGS